MLMESSAVSTPRPSALAISLEIARRQWLWVFLGAAFTAMVIQYSFVHGRLAAPPTFDDVSYFGDALERLRDLYRMGLPAVASGLVHNPPHSLFSTALAMLAYLLLGPSEWAPYAANIVIILGLAGVVSAVAKGLPQWQKLMLFVFVLTIPISSRAVFEFRPDIASALCAAVGATLLIERPIVGRTWNQLAGPAALFGLAMLFKTPTFPLTLAMLVAAFASAATADAVLSRQRSSKPTLKTGLILLAITLAVASPAYVTHLREILDYIYAPTFGRKKEIWRTAGGALWQLRFYLDGPGGEAMLSRHLHLLLAIVLVGGATILVRRSAELLVRLAGMLIVTVVAFLIPTLLTVKQPFFGTSFDWMLIFSAVYLLAWLCRQTNRIAGGAFLGIVLAVALVIAQFLPPMYEAASPIAAGRRRLIDDISAALRAQDINPRTRIYITTTGFVNADVLNFMALQRMLPPWNFQQRPAIGDLAVHSQEIRKAQYVIASEQGNSEAMDGFLAAGNIQDQTLALVRNDPEFDEIGEFPTLNGKKYFLFRRERYSDIEAITGLGPVEGPYPQWGLDKVRWGNGPQSEFRVQVSSEGQYKLMTEGRSAVAGAKMGVAVDNRIAGSYAFATNSRLERAEFTMHLTPGPHDLKLSYSDWDRAGGESRAVLFDLLKLVRTSNH
jgi:hypothetical protein